MATNPLTPAFTEAYALRDLKWIKAIFTKTNMLVILCTLGVIFMIPLSKPLFSYLVKGKTDLSYVLVSIIAIKTIVRVYSSVFTKFLTGCGKVRLIAITSMINAIVYILLVVGIGFRYNIGVNGVIFIQLILGLITASIAVIQTKKVVQNKATGIWGH
jgi:O-antigen/teichoic acid export membrane protein